MSSGYCSREKTKQNKKLGTVVTSFKKGLLSQAAAAVLVVAHTFDLSIWGVKEGKSLSSRPA